MAIQVNPLEESFQELIEPAQEQIKIHLCEKCGKAYQTKCGLKKHMDKHSGTAPLQCMVCSAQFSTKGHYEGHVSGHHGLKQNACSNCNKRFRFRSALLRHMIACGKAEEGTTAYTCGTCGVVFSRKDILVDHIKGKHEQILQFRCEPYGMRFRWRGSLWRHMKSKAHN